MKLCKNCIHILSDDEEVSTYARCTLRIEILDPVYGGHTYDGCAKERSHKGGCGPEGRFFEPKSILRRLFG